jgi:outer membrane usher protein
MDVVPRRGSGVVVSFGGSTDKSALVVLRDTAGAFLLAGTEISLDGSANTFAMGYDGEVWMEGLKAQNRIFAVTASGKCAADFDFLPDATKQVYIEDVVCK